MLKKESAGISLYYNNDKIISPQPERAVSFIALLNEDTPIKAPFIGKKWEPNPGKIWRKVSEGKLEEIKQASVQPEQVEHNRGKWKPRARSDAGKKIWVEKSPNQEAQFWRKKVGERSNSTYQPALNEDAFSRSRLYTKYGIKYEKENEGNITSI
jgi:hypothetical protein